MKKGFTLIELLAVIVILAIIALIATPIILGIINDAREKANERSVELYASAVRNGIAAHQLTGTSTPKSFADLTIQYDGNVVCETEELYEDGSFYIANCTVNGTEVDYTYGEKQVIQSTRYYAWNISGTVGITDAPIEVERLTVPPTEKKSYLGYEVTNGKISVAYVCFVRQENEMEYCLKVGNEDSLYETNKTVLENAYSDVIDTGACYFDNGNYECAADSLYSTLYSDGSVGVYASATGIICNVSVDGSFGCVSM